MAQFQLTITKKTSKEIEKLLQYSQKIGDLQTTKRCMAILSYSDGKSLSVIAEIMRININSIKNWIRSLMIYGVGGLKSKKKTGRPSKLTKNQKQELDKIICAGPTEAGFSGACWRSPMIQSLIFEKYKVFYSVHYISQLLKNMGFSYQKAKFESDHIDPEKRELWLKKTWPEIRKLAKQKNAHIMFEDEASFPQWGSLSYTWAKKGKQPVVKTSGIRKCYKVFGLIEYFSGRFYSKAIEGRFNSESYSLFLEEVLKKTRKHIILIHDGAPYHKSKFMKEFYKKNSERLTTYRLPPYSPKYNPIEMLWKKIKEKEIHLHHFPTFDDLKKRVNEALLSFKNLKHEVLALFGLYKKSNSKSSKLMTK